MRRGLLTEMVNSRRTSLHVSVIIPAGEDRSARSDAVITVSSAWAVIASRVQRRHEVQRHLMLIEPGRALPPNRLC